MLLKMRLNSPQKYWKYRCQKMRYFHLLSVEPSYKSTFIVTLPHVITSKALFNISLHNGNFLFQIRLILRVTQTFQEIIAVIKVFLVMGPYYNVAEDSLIVLLTALVTIVFINIDAILLPDKQKRRLIKILCWFPLLWTPLLDWCSILSSWLE